MSSPRKSSDPADFQDVPGYVAAMAMSCPCGTLIDTHSHKRAQLAYAVSGVMELSTDRRQWLIPPQRALWIPAGVEHKMRARTDVELRNVYVRVPDAPMPLPEVPTLVYVKPLLRELVVRAVELPIEDGASGSAAQIVALIFDELEFLSQDEFSVPAVSDRRLAKIEDRLRSDASDARSVRDWAAFGGMSERTLGRKLHSETGLSFAAWRRRIRLIEAMVRLVEGEAVTSIALSLGYENAGSFSRMFKRNMGVTPSDMAVSPAGHPKVGMAGVSAF